MNNREFLGTEPVGKLLLKLGLPSVAAQLINMLYNIVDRIYIGHIPGDGGLALTGVGVCMPIILIVSAFASLVSSGGAPRASIFMGQGEYERAERTLGACFSFVTLLSLALTALLLFLHRPLLLLFGASGNTIGYAADYMRVYALGTIFVQLTLSLNAFIAAQGRTKNSMIAVSTGAVCNILLDPLFIFGFGMGVRGAALATVLSQLISCLLCLRFLTSESFVLRLRREDMRLDMKLLLPCLALGLANFIMQSTESLIAVCFNSSLLRYGGDVAVGAMTICTSAFQFVMLPMTGVAQGAQPIMSYNFGARKPERVRAALKLLLMVCFGYAMCFWAFMTLFPGFFASVFTSDAALRDYAAAALRVYCGGLGLMGIQVAGQICFISLGNAPCSILVAVTRKIVLLLPLIYLMPTLLENKARAVFAAEPVADILAVSFTSILLFFQFRKAMGGIEDAKT